MLAAPVDDSCTAQFNPLKLLAGRQVGGDDQGRRQSGVGLEEGANLALFDSAELGRAIVAHRGDIEAALRAYDQDLFPRSSASAAESERNLRTFFDERSPASVVELFRRYRAEPAAPGIPADGGGR